MFASPRLDAAPNVSKSSTRKVALSLALSSRGRSILATPLGEHLTALSEELLSTRMILMPGSYSVNWGKAWDLSGAVPLEITVTLSLGISGTSLAKQAAVGRAFA